MCARKSHSPGPVSALVLGWRGEAQIAEELSDEGGGLRFADRDRWRLHLDVDGELVWLCAECNEREFGG
jgi:hypothetical protein